MMDISNLTEKELQELKVTIEKREKDLQYEKNLLSIRKTKEIVDLIVKNPVLLNLFPHSRNSCDDDDTQNGYYEQEKGVFYADCNRCWLNQIIQDYKTEEWEEFDPKGHRFVIDGLNFDMQAIKK